MVNKAVFTLAAVMMALFLLVSGIDRYFFVLHFLEALVYLVMMVLLYYGLVEWGYVIGLLAPLHWSVLNVQSGLLVGSLDAVVGFEFGSPIAMIGAVMFAVGIALVVTSWRAYRNEEWPETGAAPTLFLWLVLNVLSTLLLIWLAAPTPLQARGTVTVIMVGIAWLATLILVLRSWHVFRQTLTLLAASIILLSYYGALGYVVLQMVRPAQG